MPDRIIKLRKDALAALLAGVHAVDPELLVHSALLNTDITGVKMLAIGKGAPAMARAAYGILGNRIIDGLVVAPHGIEWKGSFKSKIELLYGGHPIPTEEGLKSAECVERYASSVRSNELVLCLISGGGSALLTLPVEGVTLEDIQWLTRSLLRCGATIRELNCVRKHLDRLKGGRVAALVAPAKVHALILSDVIGDPLDVISSGPVVPDPTSFADAVSIMQKFNIWSESPASVRGYLEQGVRGEVPESPKRLDNVSVEIIGNNKIAAEGVLRELRHRGYSGDVATTELTGEAREVGASLAQRVNGLSKGQCVVFAGETTVTVKGSGKGGRNQELALGAAIALSDSETQAVIGSLGTDGIDGPTDAAGGIVDNGTVTRGEQNGLNARTTLANNDAYHFLEAAGDLVVTGPTGTNVMDLQVILV